MSLSMNEQEAGKPQVAIDRACAVVLFAAGALVLHIASGYLPSGRVFPMLAAIILIICAFGLFARSFTASRQLVYDAPDLAWTARMAGFMVLIILYVIGIKHVGYTTSTLVFIPVTAYLCGLRSPTWLLLGTLIYIVVSNTIFLKLFHTQLPPDLILRLF